MNFRLKTILGIALIEITLLPILVIMSINYLKDSNEEQLLYRTNATAKLFAKSVQDAVLSYDVATIESLVSHLLNDSEIIYIRISNNYQMLFEGGDKAVLKQSRALDVSLDQVEDGIFDVAAPIEESGQRYGTVALGMSTGIIEQTISEARQYISLVALGQLVLVTMFAFLLGIYLTRQLRQLEMAAMEIRSSGPGYQIKVQGNDEIAVTMRAFNAMSESLLYAKNESDKSKDAYQQLAIEAANNAAKTKATLEACLDGIITINSSGEVVEYNTQAEEIFGWPREEMIGALLSQTIIPEPMRDAHAKGMAHFLETGSGSVLNQRLELPALRCDGRQITVQISIVPVQIDSQQMFTAFLHDITKQKEATDAIEQARIAADQANRAKSRFLATMSHEIRSPLNAVINMNDLLLESSLDEEQRQFANIAHEGGLTLLALINDILDFSQIEAGEVKLNSNTFNPIALIQSVVELHAGLAANQKLVLQTIVQPELNRKIVGDQLRLRQVVTNLLSNAIKFTSEGCVIIRLELDDTLEFFRISVIDTGEGIAPDKQEDIFKEFRQLEDQDNRRFAGSGLGLAITRRLVKLFGGNIEVESEPGKGSRFSIILPLEFADDNTSGTQQFNYSAPIFVRLGNPIIRSAITELCNLWGLTAYDAGSIPKSFDHGHESPIMLVDFESGDKIADHRLAANRILTNAQWRFIAITPTRQSKSDPLQTGYFAVLNAPVQVEALYRCICQNSDKAPNAGLSSTTRAEVEKIQRRLLLVDDNQSNLAVGKALLKPLGCEVITATNGTVAIEQASKQHYDIIFMDLAMPVMDGLTATRIIRENPGPNQSTPIIALTANAFVEDRERCLANGMTDYLSKPIVRDELINIVKRYSTETHSETVDAAAMDMTIDPTATQSKILDKKVLEQLKKDTSAEILPELINIYVVEAEKQVELMQQYHAADDVEALGREAHSLKSSSASFGVLSLSETARALELAARESNHQNITLYMENLRPLATVSIKAIKTYLADIHIDSDK